jgi:hypothetical protein
MIDWQWMCGHPWQTEIKKKLNFRCGRSRSKYSKNKIWRKWEHMMWIMRARKCRRWGWLSSQRSFKQVVGGCQRHSSGRGFDPRLGVKKISLANFTQSTWSRLRRSLWATGTCVRVGKAHVSKHKLMIGPWVVLTSDEPLCIGGCGVCGVFSICVRRLLLNIKSWGQSFPYRSNFFRMDVQKL